MSGKVNLDRWSPHLAAARREGKTLTQYARGRGLSRHTLYAARQMLGRVEGEPGARPRARAAGGRTKRRARSTFAAVKLLAPPPPSAPAPRLQARLPNGVTVELMCGGAHETLLVAAIRALAQR